MDCSCWFLNLFFEISLNQPFSNLTIQKLTSIQYLSHFKGAS